MKTALIHNSVEFPLLFSLEVIKCVIFTIPSYLQMFSIIEIIQVPPFSQWFSGHPTAKEISLKCHITFEKGKELNCTKFESIRQKHTLTKTVGSVAIVISVLFTLALERGAWKRGAGGVWVTVVGSHQTVVAYCGNKKLFVKKPKLFLKIYLHRKL